MEKFNFEINNNKLNIGEDVFNLNEILYVEIIKFKQQNSDYAIRFNFRDDFIYTWQILVDYATSNKAEILYNFSKLLTALQDNNPNFKLYNNKYILNLDNIDDVYIKKNILAKSTIIKSGNLNYMLDYSKNEYKLLQEHLCNLKDQNKGI